MILNEKIDILHAMADALMKYETIDEDQIKDLMDGKDPRPPRDWGKPSQPEPPQSTGEEKLPTAEK